MIVRIFNRRSDGFGEFRNLYNVKEITECDDRWYFTCREDGIKNEKSNRQFYYLKEDIIGLPQIVA